MRFTLHTVICCCVFTTVLPLVNGAPLEPRTSLKKRINMLLQNHMNTELDNSIRTSRKQDSNIHAGPQQDTKIATPLSRFGLKIRQRRAASGCVFVTCVYNDLLHRLHQMNDRQTKTNAPDKKMSSKGYGRRRRALEDATETDLQMGRSGQSSEAGRQLCRVQSPCTVA